ncbi:hypothetical protein SAMN03159338_1065 [Sphingomonas sp. NFR04]|uniref:hypothetical protein n=1 Tax=Sphingomonas sp. NFR04 TaxID=1566283 RepID=UPI0008F07DC3|nr:hypothetical protein [Sphingomonas sp. NFR04]SFJ20536.1 hypothetical protein SAMN03159338_1065 [Sphingomonas sp. NFR04]
MGHDIRAVIGFPEAVQAIVRGAGCPNATALPQGFAIAPLGHDQIDALTKLEPGRHVDGFVHLSDGLKNGILSLIGDASLAYIETNYFGGTGSQGAALLRDGQTVYERSTPVDCAPVSASSPINSVLRDLGVQTSDGDEFDALGLFNFRSLEALGLIEDED